jgi:hypothetical protein
MLFMRYLHLVLVLVPLAAASNAEEPFQARFSDAIVKDGMVFSSARFPHRYQQLDIPSPQFR